MYYLDFLYILYWWFIIFAIGLIFLPLTTLIFVNFFDRGYIFSKILGLIILSYITWILGSLHILQFNVLTILGILIFLLSANLFLIKRYKLLSLISRVVKIYAFEEIIFLAGFIFWAFVRTHEPSIHGLEKYMDFGFINSILRTNYFPPKDLWLPPESINYYYFGHLITAVVTKLSGIDSQVTYNLTLASLFGFTLSASFSIGANLYNFFEKNFSKIFLSGLLSSMLVTISGNLQTIYIFFKNYTPAENPVPFWHLQPMLNFSDYWYPNATRFIPNTIHEFPLYSFVVADLHGHVLNIPTVLLTIALLISIFFQKKIHTLILLVLGLIIAVALMTNVLDGPIYLLLIFLVFFFRFKQDLWKVAIVVISSMIFSLPFWLNFKPFGHGIGVLCANDFLISLGKLGPFLFEADHCQKSPLWMLTIIYGFFYFVFFLFLLKIRNLDYHFLKSFLKLQLADYLILILGLFATIAIIIPEFLYVKDIYPGHFRANTVFKFGYQAFIVFSLICGYMLTRIILDSRKFIFFTKLLILLPFSLVIIYPLFAVNSYYGGLKNYKGLDGLTYLKDLYPDDYRAIIWLRKNISGQPIILEAQGESYTDYARVSSNTGLPTVIGWPVHEWLWRGSPDEGSKRGDYVRLLYEDQDINNTLALLKKYNISYVFIGNLERDKYQNLKEDKFNNLGKIVFKNNQTIIYKINL